MNGKRVFKRALMGLQQKDVESYIHELKNHLEVKNSRIAEMERTVRDLEREKRDLIKQLNILKKFFQEQNKIVLQ